MKNGTNQHLTKLNVKVELIDDDKVVKLNNIIVKKFNVMSDDFAYTNAKEFARELHRLTPEELRNRFPEAFI